MGPDLRLLRGTGSELNSFSCFAPFRTPQIGLRVDGPGEPLVLHRVLAEATQQLTQLRREALDDLGWDGVVKVVFRFQPAQIVNEQKSMPRGGLLIIMRLSWRMRTSSM